MDAQMMNVKATVKTTTPCFTFDHIHKKIVGTELNFRKSGIPGSAQDVELMARLAEHPDYSYLIIPAKEKNRYTSVLSNRFDSTAFKKVMPEIYKA